MSSQFEIPKRTEIEKTIADSLKIKSTITRQELIKNVVCGLGLTDDDFKNSAPDSKLTAYKSIIGTVIIEQVKLGKIEFNDNVYSLKKLLPQNPNTKLKPNLNKKKDLIKEANTFEEITKEAVDTYKKLTQETQKLREKYISELKKSLLECLAVCSSEFFEEVSVKLICLIYSVPFEYGEVTGGADDGGIDGIVKITDDLGFDKEIIYIQSKCRQDIENASSATEVRAFWGAAGKKEAKKAVFITNGKMHRDAIKEAEGNRSLKLIDGDKLSELMIKFKLGVKQINELPVIDEEFFPIIK